MASAAAAAAAPNPEAALLPPPAILPPPVAALPIPQVDPPAVDNHEEPDDVAENVAAALALLDGAAGGGQAILTPEPFTHQGRPTTKRGIAQVVKHSTMERPIGSRPSRHAIINDALGLNDPDVTGVQWRDLTLRCGLSVINWPDALAYHNGQVGGNPISLKSFRRVLSNEVYFPNPSYIALPSPTPYQNVREDEEEFFRAGNSPYLRNRYYDYSGGYPQDLKDIIMTKFFLMNENAEWMVHYKRAWSPTHFERWHADNPTVFYGGW